MTRKRTPSYFIVKKWNYDPRARRVAQKACELLSRAIECVMASGYESDGLDLTRPSVAAIALMREAQKVVAKEEDDAHAAAKKAS